MAKCVPVGWERLVFLTAEMPAWVDDKKYEVLFSVGYIELKLPRHNHFAIGTIGGLSPLKRQLC